MADRYWRGGTGTWAATGTTNWSATSGGPSGATVPGAGDNVFIDNNSGTGTITLTLGSCLNFYANSTNAFTVAGTGALTVRGNFYVSSAFTWTNSLQYHVSISPGLDHASTFGIFNSSLPTL